MRAELDKGRITVLDQPRHGGRKEDGLPDFGAQYAASRANSGASPPVTVE